MSRITNRCPPHSGICKTLAKVRVLGHWSGVPNFRQVNSLLRSLPSTPKHGSLRATAAMDIRERLT